MSTVWFVIRVILVWFALILAFAAAGGIGTYEVVAITLAVAVVAVWRRTHQRRQRAV